MGDSECEVLDHTPANSKGSKKRKRHAKNDGRGSSGKKGNTRGASANKKQRQKEALAHKDQGAPDNDAIANLKTEMKTEMRDMLKQVVKDMKDSMTASVAAVSQIHKMDPSVRSDGTTTSSLGRGRKEVIDGFDFVNQFMVK